MWPCDDHCPSLGLGRLIFTEKGLDEILLKATKPSLGLRVGSDSRWLVSSGSAHPGSCGLLGLVGPHPCTPCSGSAHLGPPSLTTRGDEHCHGQLNGQGAKAGRRTVWKKETRDRIKVLKMGPGDSRSQGSRALFLRAISLLFSVFACREHLLCYDKISLLCPQSRLPGC